MTLLLTISPRTVALIRSASAAREASRTKPLVYVCSRFGNFGSGNALEGSDDHIDKSSEAQFWGMTVVMPNWAIWNAVKHFDVEDANFFTNYTDSVLKAAVLAKMLLETLFLVWVLRGGLKTICFWFEVNVLIEIFGLAAACNSYYTSWHLVLGNLCFGIGSVLMAAYYAFRFLKQLSRSDRAEAVKGLYFVLVFACRVLSVYIFMILHKMFQCADEEQIYEGITFVYQDSTLLAILRNLGRTIEELIWDIRYKVLWIGEICKHKGIGETKVLRNFFKNF